jgi:glycerol-3-phosphate dehydrogenase
VRASKGVHLVVPRSAIAGEAGLILRTPTSVLFVIPWGAHWIIGTTDTDWALDRAHPAASSADIAYILEHVNQVLERPLTPGDIEGVYAGLRPLLAGEDEATSKLSREHAVVTPAPGLVLVAGGKFTTYRVMASDVIDATAETLGPLPPSRTDELPLVGADGFHALWAERAQLAAAHQIPVATLEHLLERYGSLTLELLRLRAPPSTSRRRSSTPSPTRALSTSTTSSRAARASRSRRTTAASSPPLASPIWSPPCWGGAARRATANSATTRRASLPSASRSACPMTERLTPPASGLKMYAVWSARRARGAAP